MNKTKCDIKRIGDYIAVVKVIKSCTDNAQLSIAERMVDNYVSMYTGQEISQSMINLDRLIKEQKVRISPRYTP